MANLKIEKGVYQEGVTTQANSLAANLNLYPEIMSRVIDLYPRYTVTWLFEKLGRFDGATEIKENSFEYTQRGRIDKPWISAGVFKAAGTDTYTAPDMTSGTTTAAAGNTGTVKTGINTQIALTAYDNPTTDQYADFIHPNMLVRFQSGAGGIITKKFPQANIGGKGAVTVLVKVLHGTIIQDDVAANQVIGLVGGAFGENSKGAYDNTTYDIKRRGFVSTHRRQKTITGDAFTDVAWVTFGGQKLWFFEKEHQMEKLFAVELERKLRYSRRSMTDALVREGHPGADTLFAGGGAGNQLSWDSGDPINAKAPVIGDGLEAQIDQNPETYNGSGGLTATALMDYMNRIADKSPQGSKGNQWVVLASSLGRREVWSALKNEAHGVSGGSLTSQDTGKDMELGNDFTTFDVMGNQMIVVHDEILNDPHLHKTDNPYGLNGSGDLWFLDFGMHNGQSNMQLLSKQKRSFLKKYVKGMVDPFDEKSMVAANAEDNFSVQWLGSNGLKVENELTSGILARSNS
jgi:hypothetical protein